MIVYYEYKDGLSVKQGEYANREELVDFLSLQSAYTELITIRPSSQFYYGKRTYTVKRGLESIGWMYYRLRV